MNPYTLWFEIISELFVNIAAAWFVVVFIEPQLNPPFTSDQLLGLTLRFLVGMLTLFVAKYFREKVKENS